MKFMDYPTFGKICEECDIPELQKLVREFVGEEPADTLLELVAQVDSYHVDTANSSNHPRILEEAPGMVCMICKREGRASA